VVRPLNTFTLKSDVKSRVAGAGFESARQRRDFGYASTCVLGSNHVERIKKQAMEVLMSSAAWIILLVRPARFELAAYGFVVCFFNKINGLQRVAMIKIR
jgi:hypothetical protein